MERIQGARRAPRIPCSEPEAPREARRLRLRAPIIGTRPPPSILKPWRRQFPAFGVFGREIN
eukprot:4372773-Alexandrium_andersonii.AAC.1